MAKVKKRTQFAAMGLTLAVALILTLGFTVWFAYHSSQLADSSLKSANKIAAEPAPKVAPITSFDACKKAPGSVLLQSLPEQCVAKGGKKFIGPAQRYLVIKDWGVQVAYTSTDELSYSSDEVANLSHESISVMSHDLATTYGCNFSGAGSLIRQSATDQYASGGTGGKTVAQEYAILPTLFTKIGSYYYSFSQDSTWCGSNPTKASEAAQDAANAFTKSLVPKLTTIK